MNLKQAIEDTLNYACRENNSNTPDFILAEYLMVCLENFERTTRRREKWYGKYLIPGMEVQDEPNYDT